MNRSAIGALCAVGAIVVASLPGASALIVPPPGAPEGFSGEYDDENRTVVLTWNPPAGDSGLSYNVYRNGELISETRETEFMERLKPEGDIVASMYHVTTVSEATNQEGPPSTPFFLIETPICSPVIISINPEADPPVGGGVDEMCVEFIKRSVSQLISDLPPGQIDLFDPEDLMGL